MTQAALTIEALERSNFGKEASKKLKNDGRIPAVVYGKNTENSHISLELKEIQKIYEAGKFFSKLMDVKVGKNSLHVIPRQVQLHPVSDKLEHVDFMKVDDSTTVHVFVPVECINQDKSMGIKRGGVLNIVQREIEFVCKPVSIPGKIVIDIAGTQIGDSIHINDIKLPEGVVPVMKNNFTLATIVGRGGDDAESTDATAEAATEEKK